MKDDILINYTGCKPRFPKKKEWFTSKEAAKLLGMSNRMLLETVDAGLIYAQAFYAGTRKTGKYVKIHKTAIIMYLLSTASYTDEDFIDDLKLLLMAQSNNALLRIYNIIEDILYEK